MWLNIAKGELFTRLISVVACLSNVFLQVRDYTCSLSLVGQDEKTRVEARVPTRVCFYHTSNLERTLVGRQLNFAGCQILCCLASQLPLIRRHRRNVSFKVSSFKLSSDAVAFDENSQTQYSNPKFIQL